MVTIYNEIRIQNKNNELKTIFLVSDDLQNAVFCCADVLGMIYFDVTIC